MKKNGFLFTLLVAVCSIIYSTALHADTLTDAIEKGEVKLSFRLRYEDVDQDNHPSGEDSTDAVTVRTRLNYKTAAFNGLTGFIEMDDVTAADNDYNDTINGNKGPVIADPEGTEVNQVWLNYNNFDTDFKWGRQRIILDNARFVGNVGWRQNGQTYDAFSITNKSLQDTTLFYARVSNVNRIFGENSAGGDHNHETDLININYTGLPFATITVYGYLLDNDDAATTSSDTFGVRVAGTSGDDTLKIHYAVEFADQSDAANNTVSYDANYLMAEGGITCTGITTKLTYEVLESDSGVKAFQTPLATLHKWQGWTDKFLGTPNEGINDIYLSASGKFAGAKLMAVFHQYTSDVDNASGDDDLGDEWSFVVTRKFDRYGLQLKYSSYSAGNSTFGLTDTDKLWLSAMANF
ncbi:MAG: alginate export family protein [Pseudomonadales bacterium]